MLLLLGIFYLLVIRNNPFTTKGTTTENKSFFSLFSKLKNKGLVVMDDNTKSDDASSTTDNNQIIDDSNSNTNTENNTGGINTEGQNSGYNFNRKSSNYKLRPVPTPDYDPNINKRMPDIITPMVPPVIPKTEDVAQCNLDDYKLKFTDAEQAELDRLLREFYRIASSIKTEEDIDAENEARLSYISLANEAKDLTKQCNEQTSSAKYLAGFDWNNELNDQETTPKGQLIYTNFSRVNEARLERKNNPFYINSSVKQGYFFTMEVLNRSNRFALDTYLMSNKSTITNPSYVRDINDGISGYYSKRFGADSVEAERVCIEQSKIDIYNRKNSFPGYILTASCSIIDGPIIPPGTNNPKDEDAFGFFRGQAWYPEIPSGGYSSKKEWFYYKDYCLKRATSCIQPFANEEGRQKLARVEWVYGIDARSPSFKTLAECNLASQGKKIKTTCTGNGTEGAYINKNWTQNGLDADGDGKADLSYIPPIDYAVFENLFNIW